MASRARSLLLSFLFLLFAFSHCLAAEESGGTAAAPAAAETGAAATADSPAPTADRHAPADRPGSTDQSDWLESVVKNLTRMEYEVSESPDGWQAPNRVQNLRTYFRADGIEVVPRNVPLAAAPWRFTWRTVGWGRGQQVRPLAAVSRRIDGNRVEYASDAGLTEWYVNRPAGLEQGYTIAQALAGTGLVVLEGEIPSDLCAVLSADRQTVDFLDTRGVLVFRYGSLHVHDARGRELPSHLALAGARLQIVIEDDGALYPLTVDPLMTSPAWTADGDQAGAEFGFSVATAGDVNGDGFSDVLVGAPLYDYAGYSTAGRIFLFLGSASGLATVDSWHYDSLDEGARLGDCVAPAGDVNGDGYDDIIASAIYFDNTAPSSREGRVFVFHGGPGGPAATPDWFAAGDQTNGLFGKSVATAGDVDGDGYADVVIGQPWYANGQTREGRALVYLGSAGGLSATADWSYESDQLEAWYGWSVCTGEDLDGDGWDDVCVGAPEYDNGEVNEGAVLVHAGSASGPAAGPTWILDVDQGSTGLGGSVSTAGDVDGDGYADLLVGASGWDVLSPLLPNAGAAAVFMGSASGPVSPPDWFYEGDQADALLGGAVSTAGDVNGDGLADVIVAARQYDAGQSQEGRAYVFFGDQFGLLESPAWVQESNQDSCFYGCSVATAGDVNGDGFSEVIVGARLYDNGEHDEGQAFLYRGSAAGLSHDDHWQVEGNQIGAGYGVSVCTAGDVNGDGFSDVIVGAPYYDGGQVDEGRAMVYIGGAWGLALITPFWSAESNQASARFGLSVGTAGDVNGDGYDDVIVGAPFWDGGNVNEGGAWVYHGGQTAISPTADWTAEADQDSAYFGTSVATAGDVDNDGFGDVIVGAPQYDSDAYNGGKAWVYLGDGAGLSATAVQSWGGNQVNARLGESVGTAGDVNGDGYSDAIVGVPRYTVSFAREGAIAVFNGSPTGPANDPDWIASGGLADARLGVSVGTAGDVNGDGYSDVIAGASYYTSGQSFEGAVFVYHGSALGPSAVPDWGKESGLANAFLGHAVGTAGDVNGDGYSDVIAGMPGYENGYAFVWLGSAGGLEDDADWFETIGSADADFGWAVSTAGDVNGDGYADVIVGAPSYAAGESYEGSALVYLGNGWSLGSPKAAFKIRQGTPMGQLVALLGETDDVDFLIAMWARSPGGRNRVRMEHQVSLLGTDLAVVPIVQENWWDTGPPGSNGSYTPVSHQVSGIAYDSAVHWRVRVASASPYFPHTHWMTMPRSVPSLKQLRTEPDLSAVDEPETAELVPGVRLEAVHPNPFNPQTVIAYHLPRGADVELVVYDVGGRRVAVLADGWQEAGRQVVKWDGRDRSGAAVAAGVYLARLEVLGVVKMGKLVLVR